MIITVVHFPFLVLASGSGGFDPLANSKLSNSTGTEFLDCWYCWSYKTNKKSFQKEKNTKIKGIFKIPAIQITNKDHDNK